MGQSTPHTLVIMILALFLFFCLPWADARPTDKHVHDTMMEANAITYAGASYHAIDFDAPIGVQYFFNNCTFGWGGKFSVYSIVTFSGSTFSGGAYIFTGNGTVIFEKDNDINGFLTIGDSVIHGAQALGNTFQLS